MSSKDSNGLKGMRSRVGVLLRILTWVSAEDYSEQILWLVEAMCKHCCVCTLLRTGPSAIDVGPSTILCILFVYFAVFCLLGYCTLEMNNL